jgi:membrane-bound lytic murein transglycosylase D
MAPTARGYGLRVDGYVDERRDPERSTDAALHYLRDLHDQLGSWYLAAAAYNGGDGRVSRALRAETGFARGRSEADFWRIRHRLPRETREYVPLMLAAALVGKEPEKYGLGDVERWMPLEADTVSVPGGIPLEVVAHAAGVSEREVVRLNSHLVREATPPGKKPFPVRIPAGRSERFAAAFPALRDAAEKRMAEIRARDEAAERVRIAEARAAERRAEARAAAARRSHASASRMAHRAGSTARARAAAKVRATARARAAIRARAAERAAARRRLARAHARRHHR